MPCEKSVHFEGIPGSGKSTASELLCEVLQRNGIDASWWREESADHPVMPREARASKNTSNFPDICLDAWEHFNNNLDQIAVLDGYAFQSTVRFLFANLIDHREIVRYFEAWQQIEADTSIVFLMVDNPSAHFDVVFQERGDDWKDKLIAYVERTPSGVASGLSGKECFVQFWSCYQQLCRELLDAAQVPVEIVKARSWNVTDLEGLANVWGLI